MLKIKRKSIPEPEILNSKEIMDEYEYLENHYNQSPEDRRKRRLHVNLSLINSPEIHSSLHRLFHGKCAFCERLVSESEVNVTHFRPIGNAIHGLDERRDSPDHYGWLAYEWNNLYIACQACIRSKRNLFPVDGPRASVLSTWGEAVKLEEGTILDPCVDNPYLHFKVNHLGSLIPRTVRGEHTISVLDLNSTELTLLRQYHFDRCMEFISQLSSNNYMQNREILNEWVSPEREFSGVLTVYLRNFFDHIAKHSNTRKLPGKDLVGEIIQFLMASPSLFIEFYKKEDLEFNFYQEPPEVYDRMYEPVLMSKGYGLGKKSSFNLIKRIEITNFKSIKNLIIDLNDQHSELTPCLTLLGENSAGKSSVLQAIALCLMGGSLLNKLKLDLSRFIPRGNTRWKLRRIRPKVKIQYDSDQSVELEIDPVKLEFKSDYFPSSVVLAYGSRRFFNENSKRSNIVNRVKTLFDPLATISNPLNWLKTTTNHEFDAVVRALRFIFVLRDEDDILKDEFGRIFVKANGIETPIEDLSEGYKSLFAMAVDIIKLLVDTYGNIEQARGIVLIDEIETHLHPRWKLKVMSAFRQAFPQVQFIVSTHDPLCLRGMQQGEVQVLFRDEHHGVDNVSELPNIKNLRTEQLLTSDFFGLKSTVDKELESPIDEYIDLLRSSEGPQTEREKARLNELDNYFKNTLLIGDTPAQQLMFKAIDEYLDRSQKVKINLNKESVKQEAVNEIVSLLESHRRIQETLPPSTPDTSGPRRSK
jgi:uncharacterized protein (TIGR02646 family)